MAPWATSSTGVYKVLEYLDQLGYKMVLVPKGKRLAEGDYEITE